MRSALPLAAKHAAILAISISFIGCGDPAPGEAMSKPLAKGPLPEIVPASVALNSIDLTKVDPSVLNKAEVEKVLSTSPRCSFAYGRASPPIFAGGFPSIAANAPQNGDDRTTGATGVAKLHGRLFRLWAADEPKLETLVDGASFSAENIRIEIAPDADDRGATNEDERTRPATLHFKVREEFEVGYRGWYTCET